MSETSIKGIITAGGKGTRLSPLTRPVNKSILPVYDKPVLYYQICAMIMAGVREIKVFGNKRDIPMYRDLLGDGKHLGIDIYYGVDEPPRTAPGIMLTAQDFIGKDDVMILYGDNVFFGEGLDRTLEKAVDRFRVNGGTMICTKKVRDPRGFGVVEYDDSGRILSIGSKLDRPRSDNAVTGLFFFDNSMVGDVRDAVARNAGEVVLAEFLQSCLRRGILHSTILDDDIYWFDVGTAERLYVAGSAVREFQMTHKTYAGCVEEIAADRGLIDDRQLEFLALEMEGTEYSRHLMGLVDNRRNDDLEGV